MLVTAVKLHDAVVITSE